MDSSITLNPPQSRGEKMRDSILKALDHPFAQAMGIVVLLLVIIDGALFFFLLVGWQSMCRPRVDCEPRNWWYNFSVQLLTALFTYMAVASMPWRCTNFLHISGLACPRRENSPGHDLYGQVNIDDPWYSIPRSRRLGITLLLLANCITQFANQATRMVYYNFELQNDFPGNLWTNVFFGSSFLCAAMAGAWLAYETSRLRKQSPNRFGPGPIDLAKHFYMNRVRGGKDADTDEPEETEAEREHVVSAKDITREPLRRSILDVERSSMRLWAM